MEQRTRMTRLESSTKDTLHLCGFYKVRLGYAEFEQT